MIINKRDGIMVKEGEKEGEKKVENLKFGEFQVFLNMLRIIFIILFMSRDTKVNERIPAETSKGYINDLCCKTVRYFAYIIQP